MTRNSLMTVMMAAMMSMMSLSSNAQGRGFNSGRGSMNAPQMQMNQRGGMEMSGSRGSMQMSGRSEMSERNNKGMSNMSGRGGMRSCSDMRGGRMECGRGRCFDGGYNREMCGHRWDRDGWMEGWHGRVRHFDDGRWGYFRDGAWFYYDTFYEPDFFFAHPVGYFSNHLMSPAGRAAVGITAGAVALTALISALAH